MKKDYKSQFCYAVGAFGNDVFFAVLNTVLATYFVKQIFTDGSSTSDKYIAIISSIVFILRFVELAIDPLIGGAVDLTKSKWGKFKPWILIGSFVGSVCLIIMLSGLGSLSQNSPVTYLVLFTLIYLTFDVFYSFKDIAFWSMIPALGDTSEQRGSVATWARVGSTLGAQIVPVVINPIIFYFSITNLGGTGDRRGWFIFGIIIGVVTFLTAVVVCFGVKERQSDLRDKASADGHTTALKDIFKVLVQNDQLLWIALAYLIYDIGSYWILNLNMIYFNVVLNWAAGFTIYGIVAVIIGILIVPCYPFLVGVFGRKKLFQILIAIKIITCIGLIISGTVGHHLLVQVCQALFFLVMPLMFLIILMAITDSVEYGQLKTGIRSESATLALRPMVDKLTGAVAGGIVTIVCLLTKLTGDTSPESITDGQRHYFINLMYIAPIALFIIAAIIWHFKVKMTEKRHDEILQQLTK